MPRFAAVLSIFLLFGVRSPAGAQSISSQPTRRLVIERTCARDIERYCPDLANTGQQRNQVICLKPYRLDLARPCHRAVDAALR